MSKFIITLVSVMLVVILVFTAFGISFSRNDFFSAFIKAENYINQFSNWFINAFKNIKSQLSVFSDFIKDFEESTGAFKGTLNVFKTAMQPILHIGDIFDFFGRYGVNFMDSNLRRAFSLYVVLFDDSNFISDGVLNRDKCYKYIDAVVYGAENEYSYVLTYADSIANNHFNNASANSSIGVFCSLKTWSDKPPIEESDYFIVCDDFNIPSSFLPGFNTTERLKKFYFNRDITVYDSNIYYVVGDQQYELVNIRLTPVESNVSIGSIVFNNDYKFKDFKLSDNVEFDVLLVFESSEQGRYNYLTLEDFIISKVGSWELTLMRYYNMRNCHIYDFVYES